MLKLGDLDRLPVIKVPIDSLKSSNSPRSSGENLEHIRALAESEVSLPPIIVHRESMCVIDGMHRLHVARLRGQTEIEARFFDGDEASSYVLAVSSNIAHGLPLSLADRKTAARRIIELYPDWSDRAIAHSVGLAAKTVATIRKSDFSIESPTEEHSQLDGRIGRDGRVRPQNRAERRELARKLIQENPSASLRQVAELAGLSPETVRSVRASLSRAESNEASEEGRVGKDQAGTATGGTTAASPQPAPRPEEELVQALNALRSDPAFRSTESGRSLLRMFSVALTLREQGHVLLTQVPIHRLGWVSRLANECAQAWTDLAEAADHRQGSLAGGSQGRAKPWHLLSSYSPIHAA